MTEQNADFFLDIVRASDSDIYSDIARVISLRIIIIVIIFYPRYQGSRGNLKKIDTKEKIVGVTITPSSPPEQKNRAAKYCYIAARARKRAGTKMQSPARARMLADFLR